MTTGNRTSTHTSDGRCADHGTDQAAAIAYETLGFKLFRSEKLSSSIRARKIVELALDAHLSPADDSSLHDSQVFLRIFSVTRDRFTRAIQLGFAPIGFKITVETEDRFVRRPSSLHRRKSQSARLLADLNIRPRDVHRQTPTKAQSASSQAFCCTPGLPHHTQLGTRDASFLRKAAK